MVGYEGYYEISNQARIRSLDRVRYSKNGVSWVIPGAMKKCPPNDRGYPHVSLYKNGRGKTTRVHCLVAEAFLGPRPIGYQICHNDGCRANSWAENLRYGTVSENQLDRAIHGTSNAGDRSAHNKLTENEVREIRAAPYYRGLTRDLSRTYRVTTATVSNIRHRKMWRHLA